MKRPDVLYERVIEIDERVGLKQDNETGFKIDSGDEIVILK